MINNFKIFFIILIINSFSNSNKIILTDKLKKIIGSNIAYNYNAEKINKNNFYERNKIIFSYLSNNKIIIPDDLNLFMNEILLFCLKKKKEETKITDVICALYKNDLEDFLQNDINNYLINFVKELNSKNLN